MGVNIHANYGLVSEINSYIFDHQQKYATLNKSEDIQDLVNDLLGLFGVVTPDGKWFIQVHNEYYQDDNAGWEFPEFLNRYFGIEGYDKAFELPLTSAYDTEGMSADDAAYRLKIEDLPELDYENGNW